MIKIYANQGKFNTFDTISVALGNTKLLTTLKLKKYDRLLVRIWARIRPDTFLKIRHKPGPTVKPESTYNQERNYDFAEGLEKGNCVTSFW